MKKIIIFIIYIYSGDCKGQSSVSTFIQTLLDTVYANYYDHPVEDEVRIYFADSALKHNYFIKDSNLLVLCKNYYNFRYDLVDTINFSGFIPSSPLELDFYYRVQGYIRIFDLIGQPMDLIESDLIRTNDFYVLKYLPMGTDTNYYKNKILDSSNLNLQVYCLEELMQLMDSSQFLNFYRSNRNFIFSFPNLFLLSLYHLNKNFEYNVFDSIDINQFTLNFDTTFYFTKSQFQYFFNEGEYPVDSISMLMMHKFDSLGEIDYDLRHKKELFEMDSDLRKISDPVDTSLMNSEELRMYYISLDTTFAFDGEHPFHSWDDGVRYDTFSNVELIEFLRELDYDEVYDSFSVNIPFEKGMKVIRLQKIFQILGDRNTFGSYTLSPQDTGLLYAWVDKYYDAVLHSSYPAMQDEAADQILRLWRLVYPRWVGWLKNENLMERILIKQRIIYILNEELILDLIARGDAVYTPESPKEAHILADPLLDVFYGVVIPEHLKSARRPSWSAVDAQRWVDDYIVPALKRWKYFGF
jgi:hypothetical protein